ncbi:hypothetical protein T265_00498 [Opisthorchis viverrini]|uniref:Uncharacterized protein n=1 Tax=Opisthorchis viverrini TaxID=6198 RepID=A0A075A1K2_OPIVI|nr:hypothetical protein T265_00498 [Opisthorchis viverrini]KER33603.1 hypothetical protein T265_00498 [Opisthorchis viverrini]
MLSELQKISLSCSTLSVPSCHTSRRKHEDWNTAKLPKPRLGKLRDRSRVRTTHLPVVYLKKFTSFVTLLRKTTWAVSYWVLIVLYAKKWSVRRRRALHFTPSDTAEIAAPYGQMNCLLIVDLYVLCKSLMTLQLGDTEAVYDLTIRAYLQAGLICRTKYPFKHIQISITPLTAYKQLRGRIEFTRWVNLPSLEESVNK